MITTILIAESDATLCDGYQAFLTEQGFASDRALHGLSCVKKMRENRPDLLILDLQLRWGSADGVLALMREESLLLNIPVILTDVINSFSSKQVAIEPPVVRFLSKPISHAAFLQTIWEAIPPEKQLSQPSDSNRTSRDLDVVFNRIRKYLP